MKKSNDLTRGNVKKQLIFLTIPMIIGILGMVAFNLIDTFFVGKLGKEGKELAAISFTFPVVMFIASIAMGMGIGTSSVISRAIGEGDHHKVKRLTTDALILALILVSFFVLIGLLTITPLFKILGAKNKEMLVLIKQYMTIWYFGVPFVIIPMIGNNAIRANGDTKSPSFIMIVAIIVNLVLDPILIFGWGPIPKMGIQGAAIATVISRAVTLVVSLWILKKKYDMLCLKIKFEEMLESWKKILYIGLPAAGNRVIMPISIGIITRMIATYGDKSVAAFGVASRIEAFALTIIGALATVLIPFIGQNLGAKKINRIKIAIKQSYVFSLLWGFFLFLVFLFLSKPIASIFNADDYIIKTIALYLMLVSISYSMHGILTLSNSIFNAINKPFPVSILTITRMFILYIPIALLFSHLFKIKGIFIAATIANIICGLWSIFWVTRHVKQLELEIK